MSPSPQVSERILFLRGTRVILDADLASLYGVQTRVLLQAVRRNPERFPAGFAFVLMEQDLARLRSQSVISNSAGRGGRRTPPVAFTEHGAIMAATVLNSSAAIAMSVHVVRAFVRMREAMAGSTALARRLDELERKVGAHDRSIADLVSAIRQLLSPPDPPRRRRIGFL